MPLRLTWSQGVTLAKLLQHVDVEQLREGVMSVSV